MATLTDRHINVMRAILWQYEGAEKFIALFRAKQAWLDENVSAFWRAWIRDVFDLRTANEFGLGIWARILGVPLSIMGGEDTEDEIAWGFGQPHEGFSHGNFARSTGNLRLNVEQQRVVLRLRYYQLTMRPTVSNINDALADVFADMGQAYVIDQFGMQPLAYVFAFPVPETLRLVLENLDVLPRPSTLGVMWGEASTESYGYELYYEGFDQGTFEI